MAQTSLVRRFKQSRAWLFVNFDRGAEDLTGQFLLVQLSFGLHLSFSVLSVVIYFFSSRIEQRSEGIFPIED